MGTAACVASIRRAPAWIALGLLLLLSTPQSADAVRSTKLYDVLGVPTDADDRTIKKAYKKQAL